jgi:hypothetical protein
VIPLTPLAGMSDGAGFTSPATLWSWEKDSVHSPKKAAILSALLPGAGQAYNRKYWKMPIVYAAGGTGAWLIITNNRDYRIYKQAYIYRTDDDPDTVDDFPFATAQRLKVYRDYYLRNLELSVIYSFAIYMLQILDATVDAHLFDFDVSNNLSLNLQPVLIQSAGAPLAPGIKLSLSLSSKQKSFTPETAFNQRYMMGLSTRVIHSSK